MKSTTTSSAMKPTSHKVHGLSRLLRLNRPHLKKIIPAAICALLVNGALLAKPYILKIVIDDFLTKHVVQRGFYSLTAMGILYFVIVACSGIFSIVQTNLINRAGQEIMHNLRNQVFKTIQLLPLRYLDKVSSGDLITRATNDVEALSELYTDVLIGLFKDILLVIGIVGAMLVMDVRLALVSLSVLPAMFMIIFLLRKKIKQNFRKMKTLIGKINGLMAENIAGMKLIQIFHGEREKKTAFVKLNDAYYKSTSYQVWMNSFLKPATIVFENLAVALLIWYGMGRIANQTLQIGILYAFTSYIKQFLSPISDLADNYTNIQSALVSADRIFELLDQKNNLENLTKGTPIARLSGNIEFKHVWFLLQ
ncbi:MAG: ABC transporter ATP-binding protein [Spirochaetia bacterium]|nr:ABC transporter ATP-binding protein [Spirochaetia bacterium]